MRGEDCSIEFPAFSFRDAETHHKVRLQVDALVELTKDYMPGSAF